MLLAIDAGNTTICFALFQERRLLKKWRIATPAPVEVCTDIPKEWSARLRHELTAMGFSDDDIEDVIISCVVPKFLRALHDFCLRCFSREPFVVGEPSLPLPVASLIDRPGEEGADLMANAFAAHVLYQGPLLVIDFGTATTLSLVDHQGNFCGAIIAPGVNVSLQALYQSAAKLPEVPVIKPRNVIGTNTIDAMQSGIFWGYISMIEGLVARIKAENFRGLVQDGLKVVATGGLSSLIAPSCSAITHIDADLTVKGLAFIYETLEKGK